MILRNLPQNVRELKRLLVRSRVRIDRETPIEMVEFLNPNSREVIVLTYGISLPEYQLWIFNPNLHRWIWSDESWDNLRLAYVVFRRLCLHPNHFVDNGNELSDPLRTQAVADSGDPQPTFLESTPKQSLAALDETLV